MKHLILKIIDGYFIKIDHLDIAHTGCCKILNNRRAQGTGSNDHNSCRLDPLLPLDSDLSKQQMFFISFHFLITKKGLFSSVF